MSDGYGSGALGQPDPRGGNESGAAAAKHEAAAVKDTATDAAKGVAHTAKDEAASVAGEAKSQVRSLYSQGISELGDQASHQQQRLASGIRSAGDELGAMAQSSESRGVATDVVQQVSQRLSGAASYLEGGDPSSVIADVKRLARRRPVLFIAGAAVAGVVVGRLVRALASNQHDGSPSGVPSSGAGSAARPAPSPHTTAGAHGQPLGDVAYTPAPAAAPVEDAPIYAQSAADWNEERGEAADERRDTV